MQLTLILNIFLVCNSMFMNNCHTLHEELQHPLATDFTILYFYIILYIKLICLPIVWSRENGDTFAIMSNFIAFIFNFMTTDNVI